MSESGMSEERGESLLSLFERLDESEYLRVIRDWSGYRVHVLVGDVMVVYQVGEAGWALIDRVYEQELLFSRDPLRVFDELADSWREQPKAAHARDHARDQARDQARDHE
ncbi:hypothetical protein ACNOYE_13770 [Nannocystaceae bacterium ST9]